MFIYVDRHFNDINIYLGKFTDERFGSIPPHKFGTAHEIVLLLIAVKLLCIYLTRHQQQS